MACAVCEGSGLLLFDICPLCDGDPFFCIQEFNMPEMIESPQKHSWQILLGINWITYDLETEKLIQDAEAAGVSTVEYSARRQNYIIDLKSMQQINQATGVRRSIRKIEAEVAVKLSQPDRAEAPPRSKRLTDLVETLLSPAVQVALPIAANEEHMQLSPAEVSEVFIEHVPGVEKFLYREMADKRSLNFIITGYQVGLNAFAGTPLHDHLLWLLRLIVHYGHARKVGASRYLREVAEAFMDCQAVQARAIERVGLEIRGISLDFKGHVAMLIGEYKSMAIKMLACERIAQRFATDDGNPTHYENRLISDLGNLVGLNKDEIRQANLDGYTQRFAMLTPKELVAASARHRELFDIEALLKALTAQLNSFDAESPPESLPQQFLKWAAASLTQKHVVFDANTCMSIDVEDTMVLAIIEVLFLGRPSAMEDETYRGVRLNDLFHAPESNDQGFVEA
eukprot:gnl/MRDRNA2_/MRDRNA2_92408_c0_seq1.p1 gnl/MRDRNA2_/MRDRNA2_92408_c0~~gnl/MRDRNA2_/MRDRNA2_92408_c0_seq1.p1  ORF type:complete len:454 (+),score=89.13 gnl/MRDRNA2_/MRDRNA2_92408_c0_seq1:90-1451(+)